MPTPGSVESVHNGCSAAAGLGSCRCGRMCSQEVAPILLLAIGNPLMADDGAGQQILAQLQSKEAGWGSDVEFVDGGTQGLALLGKFEGRKAVIFLDAVRLGYKPGAVHVINGPDVLQMGRRPASSAHEGSAPDILRALQLLGDTPAEVVLVGIEPERVETRIGLSPVVRESIPLAAGFARMAVNRLLEREAR